MTYLIFLHKQQVVRCKVRLCNITRPHSSCCSHVALDAVLLEIADIVLPLLLKAGYIYMSAWLPLCLHICQCGCLLTAGLSQKGHKSKLNHVMKQLIAASEQRLQPQAQLFDCTPVTPLILLMAAGLKQQHTRADMLRFSCTVVCNSLLIPEGGMLVFFLLASPCSRGGQSTGSDTEQCPWSWAGSQWVAHRQLLTVI